MQHIHRSTNLKILSMYPTSAVPVDCICVCMRLLHFKHLLSGWGWTSATEDMYINKCLNIDPSCSLTSVPHVPIDEPLAHLHSEYVSFIAWARHPVTLSSGTWTSDSCIFVIIWHSLQVCCYGNCYNLALHLQLVLVCLVSSIHTCHSCNHYYIFTQWMDDEI